ncbi:MAG: hypothetical protein HY427_01275 [Candidatus Levybacteria bacterium]|nr:hypothetical protein [Candidatus Levybacteria bacterium]
MAIAKEKQTSTGVHAKDALSISETHALLEEAGYEQVSLGNLPKDIHVFKSGREIKRHGLVFQRCYALKLFGSGDYYVIGWPRINGQTSEEIDLVQSAVDNCLNREKEATKRAHPFDFLTFIHQRFRDSLGSQIMSIVRD